MGAIGIFVKNFDLSDNFELAVFELIVSDLYWDYQFYEMIVIFKT